MRHDHSISRLSSAAFLVALLIFILCAVGFGQTTQPVADNLIRRTPTDPSPAPVASPAKPGSLDLSRVAMSLAVVIALIYATRWLLKRMTPAGAGNFGASRTVKVLSRTSISPKQQVLVLQVGQRLIVVGDSGQQLSTLCQITDLDESAALVAQIRRERDQPAARTFAALLGRAGEKFQRVGEPDAAAGVTHSASLNDADLGLATTREELDGLMEKVRDMQRTLKQR